MSRIRKDDLVIVKAGKDKGKTGKVLKVFPNKMRALVQGLNFVKKHTRRTREDRQGGIIEKENPIHISSLMLYCTKCSRPTRIGIKFLEDGSKSRFCKRCGEAL